MTGCVDPSANLTTADMMLLLGCSVTTKVVTNTLSSHPVNKTFELCSKVILLVVRGAAGSDTELLTSHKFAAKILLASTKQLITTL